MAPFKQLIREIHRRSLWQVLGIYVVSAVIGYEAVQALVEGLGLPEWFPAFAIVLFIIGLPIVLATAVIQEGGPASTRSDPTLLPHAEAGIAGEAPGVRRLFTWRNAIMGGVLAFALWGVIAAGWILIGGGVAREGAEAVVTDPNVVAVFPFRTAGADPALGYLREGMVDLLAAKLNGEGGPRAADPRTVMSAWRRAVESEDEDLPQARAVELAEALGAGQLLLGEIVGTPGGVVINASIVGVPGGQTRARASVDGPADSLPSLVDKLTAQLLALEAGEAGQRLATLTSTSLPALRAYLDGQAAYRRGAYREAERHFERAVQVDSSFALAALGLSAAAWWGGGAPDTWERGVALASAHRDRLSPRERAFLVGWAGPEYPEPSPWASRLRSWEHAIEVAPDGPEPWFESGDILFHYGSWLGLEGPWEQAAAAHFRRALELDSTFAAPLGHLMELAVLAGDTSAVRHLDAAYLALDSLGDLADFIRWLMAHGLDDSASVSALRARFPVMSRQSLQRIAGTSQLVGIGLADLEPAAAALRGIPVTRTQRADVLDLLHRSALNGGRPRAALELTEAWPEVHPHPREHLRVQILDALYWDGDNAAAARAVRQLAEHADAPLVAGAAGAQARQRQHGDICVIEQWRLWHGEVSTAEQAIARLRNAEPGMASDSLATPSAVCATLLEALLAGAQKRPDGAEALGRLESIMRMGPGFAPLSTVAPAGDPVAACGNLVVARLREAQGDLAGALAALRRRPYHWGDGIIYLSSYLREEGRLAALTGDREGAIRAYQHYMALRSDPEPALAAEVDRVRAELAELLDEAGS